MTKLENFYKENYFKKDKAFELSKKDKSIELSEKDKAIELSKKDKSINDVIYNTVIGLVKTGTVKIIEDSSKNLFKENIIINPSLSDYDRKVPVIAGIDLIINNPNLFRKIFGYGFYSHKEELIEPINKILLNRESLSKYRKFYYEKPTFPVRTASLPAIITDGGFFLVIIYIVIFSIIGLRILKDLNSINKSNFYEMTIPFLNKGLIISFIFFLNYINYNLDCVFIYMILINPNHFTDFDFDA